MSFLSTAKRILSERGDDPEVSEPVVYTARVLATSPHGVSVVERHSYLGDGGVSWERVAQAGETGTIQLLVGETRDPFVAAGWLSIFGTRECLQAFREEWGLAWIIKNVGPELLVFASDYTHPEGTSDPIGKFEATMTDCDQDTMDKFYYGNMAELMGLPK